jgi:hypothetical protein
MVGYDLLWRKKKLTGFIRSKMLQFSIFATSSTTKTGRHDIAESGVKNTKNQSIRYFFN